jgi:hypothetical protein
VKPIDRQVFVTSGAKGGRTSGPSKRRGDPEYYRALSKKAAAARKRKREERNG